METHTERILITGALGQIGTELILKLSEIYGAENLIASDLKPRPPHLLVGYETLDVTDAARVTEVVKAHNITTVYHLASLLSGTSEQHPLLAWKINLDPLLHFCELAKEGVIKRIFWPSSIAVFGKGISKNDVAQDVVLNPTTVYGISKMAGEKWCEYYHEHFGVDVRSIRYPGLISWKTPAGGGTTDYAVEIFYKAVQEGRYTSFIQEHTAMPMLYMDDAISATLKLMNTPAEQLSVWSSYNLGGLSFTPAQLTKEIQKEIPKFSIAYEPDFRQAIAESWPSSIDDSVAKRDWGLSYDFDIEAMSRDMIHHLKAKLL